MPSSRERDPESERLVTGPAGRLAVLIAVGWMSVLMGRQALPPLLPTVIEQLRLSPSLAGFALTLMMACYALLQYPAGRLSDGLSRTTVLVGSIGGVMVGFALLGTVESYPRLLLGAAIVGACSAFYFTPSRAFLSDLFVERRGQALGMQTTAGMAGSALAAGVAVVTLRVATWRAAFVPSMVVLGVVVVLLHRWSPEPYVLTGANVDVDPVSTVVRLVRSPRLRLLLGMRAIVGFTFQAVVGFLPALLQFEKGFSPTVASGCFALLFVVGGVCGPLAGRLSDRMPRLNVVLGGLVGAIVGIGVLVVASGLVTAVAGVVVLAAGLMSLVPVIQAYLMDWFPSDSVGGDYGAAKMIFTGLGSLGPTYVGVLVGYASYTVAFATLVPLLLVGTGLLLAARARAE